MERDYSNNTVIVYDHNYSGLMKLSVEQKCDIAAREVEVLREEMARKDKEYEQLLDSYRVCYSDVVAMTHTM